MMWIVHTQPQQAGRRVYPGEWTAAAGQSAGIRGGVIIFRDVTERLLAEEALAQAFAQGRLEVMDTILHNIGNAINSVTTGIETVRQHLGNDYVGRRLFALASAVREHQDDWSDYIENDPQGRKVMPFIVELSENFSKRNEELTKTSAASGTGPIISPISSAPKRRSTILP